MNRDDIIRIAREAGYLPDGFGFGAWDMKEFNEAIALAYEAGRKDEREACAKVCDKISDEDGFEGGYANRCAFAIRERGAP